MKTFLEQTCAPARRRRRWGRRNPARSDADTDADTDTCTAHMRTFLEQTCAPAWRRRGWAQWNPARSDTDTCTPHIGADLCARLASAWVGAMEFCQDTHRHMHSTHEDISGADL